MPLLHRQEVGDLNLYLFTISIISILFYLKSKNIIYLIIAFILFAFSIVGIIDRYIFLDLVVRGFIYFLVIGIFLNLLYLRTRTKNYLLFGNILIVLSLNSLLSQIIDLKGLLFLLIGASFYISYLVTYREHRIVWPKYLSISFFTMGLLIQFFLGQAYKIIYVLIICIISVGIGKLCGTIYKR